MDKFTYVELFRAKAEEGANTARKVIENNPYLLVWAKKKNFKAIQLWFEKNFSKQNSLSVIQEIIFEDNVKKELVETVLSNNGLEAQKDKIYRLISLMALHKGYMTKNGLHNMIKNWFKSLEEVCEFVDVCTSCMFIKEHNGAYLLHDCFRLDDKVLAVIKNFITNPWMVCTPRKVRANKKKTGATSPYLDLKFTSQTKKADRHAYLPYDTINMQNNIKYAINYALWDLYIKDHPYVPSREDGMSDPEYEVILKNAAIHHSHVAFAVEFNRLLGIDVLYILTQMDYRHRNYAKAYEFNPQGTDRDKALLCYASQKPLTVGGLRWLKITIANSMNVKYEGRDLDKHTHDVRVKWFNEVMSPLHSLPKEEFLERITAMADEADSPACFFGQALNWWEIINEGGKLYTIGHLDATASGYQIQSIIANDLEMARLVNLVPNEKNDRIDIYTVIYAMLVAQGLPEGYTRETFKKKVAIPAMYNSIKCIAEYFKNPKDQKTFDSVMRDFAMWRLNRSFPSWWNPEWTEYRWVLPDMVTVFKKVTQDVEVAYNHKGEDIYFTFAQNTTKKWSLELGPNITHSFDGFIARELTRRCSMPVRMQIWIKQLYVNESEWTRTEDSRKSRELMTHLLEIGKIYNFYSFRIFHEITPANIDLIPDWLMQKFFDEIAKDPYYVAEIHDSFGVLPNYMDNLSLQYKRVLRDFCLSNFLSVVFDFLHENPLGTSKGTPNEEFAKLIMESTYAIC